MVQSFKESLGGGMFVKNLEIFWMDRKTIIEFGFPMMWRIGIMLILQASSTKADNKFFLICIILHIILNNNC